MNRQTNFSRNTIGANANANAGKIMKQAVEIQLGSSSGKTMFQNLTQLDGAVIVTISIVPPKISSYSAQTYDSNIPTLDDYKAMFFTFLRQDVQILENIPALDMNPYNDNDSATATTANNNPFWDQNFSPQIIDFNKSYVWMAAAPSTPNIKVSLMVEYYYPVNG